MENETEIVNAALERLKDPDTFSINSFLGSLILICHGSLVVPTSTGHLAMPPAKHRRIAELPTNHLGSGVTTGAVLGLEPVRLVQFSSFPAKGIATLRKF